MKKEFVMRGQTASGLTDVLNFSGYKPGYAYRLTEFQIYPSTNIVGADFEGVASITAGKTTAAPTDPNFNDEGCIASVMTSDNGQEAYPVSSDSVINDTFLITQNLILKVKDTHTSATAVNWQCKFESVKMTGPEEAATNFKQFSISDG